MPEITRDELDELIEARAMRLIADGFVPDDGTHALRAGFVFGALMKAGLQAEPEVDDEGNFTSILKLTLTPIDKEITIRLRVLPP